MGISIFQLFNIGIGPSSSHTVGPMRASNFFIEKLKKHNYFEATERIKIELYGSLSLTGVGHGSDRALLIGLEGHWPEKVKPSDVINAVEKVKKSKAVHLNQEKTIKFDLKKDLIFKKDSLPFHPNGMIYYAYNKKGILLYKKHYYSIGGGFIVGQKTAKRDEIGNKEIQLKYQFDTATKMLEICHKNNKSISEITYENELVFRSKDEIDKQLLKIWSVMKGSINAGLKGSGTLPGRLKVTRRAKSVHKMLKDKPEESLRDPLTIMDWVNLYALSVNEENAAGGRVVTAPTNGAAGIIPAVLMYFERFGKFNGDQDVKKFLLTAGAVGILYKKNASISGAEVGCQGEVGVACSMAAAGLCELLGGTPEQVENAAEIGMEHNLGLTCDPIDGMVQIPCIERNAMAAIKAINAARIALKGSGKHFVSLDNVMKTMKETGLDMQKKYKETSEGGLAVNVTAC